MLDLFYTWIAVCMLFVLSTIWSEENVRYGYVLVPLLAAFFWWVGFLQYAYLGTIIPLIIVMGVLAHLRAIGKYKFGIFGSNSGMLVKIVVFIIFIQMTIGFVNTLGIFTAPAVANQTNEYTTYTLTKAESVYTNQTTGISIADVIANGWNLLWTSWVVIWGMLWATVTIYPILVNVFHIPPAISMLLQAGIYMIYAMFIFTQIFKPYQPVEI